MKISIQTTAELARQLGVSRWTVSRALNGHGGVGRETAERIREAAKQSGFSPSILGRGLRAGRTDLVGVCVPDLEDYFLTSKISRLQEAVLTCGLHAMLHITDGSESGERWAIERFAAMHCSALVLIASSLTAGDGVFAGLHAGGMAVVSIDPRHPGHRLVVSTDRVRAMRDAARWCFEAGHAHIAVAGIIAQSPYGKQRIRGIRAGCCDAGMDYKRDITSLVSPVDLNDFASGSQLAAEYLHRFQPPYPPVIALNDRVAIAMIQGLRAGGLRVPDDVSMIGFDNADFSAYSEPPLSTIDPQVESLISHAVELLIPGASPDSRKHILVRPKLIHRESTICASMAS